MANKILFGAEARAKLKEGIDWVAKSVAVTLGANGRNGVYNKWSRIPIITNDGVSIAREVEPEDLGALQGANLIKQVSERTNDEAGDGTTTSIVLAHSMIEQGMKLLDSDPTVNPMQLRREMKDAADKVLEALKTSAIKIDSLESLEQVATISVEDSTIGKTIATAIFDAGSDGIVYVNESEKVGVSIEKTNGYQFPQGIVTPYLITDPQRMETVLENVAVFITEIPLYFTNEFSKMIKETVDGGTKNILVICDELHPDVIKFAFMNMIPKDHPKVPNFILSLVKKPMQKEYLEDIASVVGATAMTSDKGLVHPRVNYLGRAKKIIVTEKNTTIFEGVGDVDTYVTSLKTQHALAEDENTKTKLQERIAKLTGGVYMINVGDKTEAESKYLKMKVDDAVSATKAAKEEGIVAGGGMALFNISASLMDEKTNGASIIYQACIQPLATIVKNSGGDFTEIANRVNDSNKGFDALTLTVVPDMIKAGIIDPVKVTRSAFANAASFAGLLLTTETLITPLPTEETRQPKF